MGSNGLISAKWERKKEEEAEETVDKVSRQISIFFPPAQVQELHSKHGEEALKAEKWQFEYKNLKEKFEALVKEKEVM